MNQLSLFDQQKKRLSKQCQTILEMLTRGPCTNRELSKVALKYTSRISDLRKAGHVIECELDRANGLAVYKLDTASESER